MRGQIEQTQESVTAVTDAASQRVELASPPSHIAVVGKAALIPADALFMFDTAHTANGVHGKDESGSRGLLRLSA